LNISLPLLLHVRLHVYASADHLQRRPIFGRSAAYGLTSGRGASRGGLPNRPLQTPSPVAKSRLPHPMWSERRAGSNFGTEHAQVGDCRALLTGPMGGILLLAGRPKRKSRAQQAKRGQFMRNAEPRTKRCVMIAYRLIQLQEPPQLQDVPNLPAPPGATPQPRQLAAAQAADGGGVVRRAR
jgi:hypothetical protein